MGFYREQIVPHLLNLAMRNRLLEPYRQRMVGMAEGRVLEIGVGSGVNLPWYTGRVKEVIGLEPQPKLLKMAARMPHRVPVNFIEGSAEAIPLESRSVDCVVMTWTLCSVGDAPAALTEMRRVLKPSGKLLLVEHGLAPEEKVRKWQHRLTPAWKHFAGGCHLDRPIAELVENSGFRFDRLETGYMQGPKAMTFLYEGIALPRS